MQFVHQSFHAVMMECVTEQPEHLEGMAGVHFPEAISNRASGGPHREALTQVQTGSV